MEMSIDTTLCLRLSHEDGNHRYLIMAKVLYTNATSHKIDTIWHNVSEDKEKGELFCYKGQMQSRAYNFAKYLSTKGIVYESYTTTDNLMRTTAMKFDCLEFIALKLMEGVPKTEDYENYCRIGHPLTAHTISPDGKETKEVPLTSDELELFEEKYKMNTDERSLVFTKIDVMSNAEIRKAIGHRIFKKVDHYFVIDMTPENELEDKQFMTRKKYILNAIGTKYPHRALRFMEYDMAFNFAQKHMMDFPSQGFDIVQVDKENMLEVNGLNVNYWEHYWR